MLNLMLQNIHWGYMKHLTGISSKRTYLTKISSLDISLTQMDHHYSWITIFADSGNATKFFQKNLCFLIYFYVVSSTKLVVTLSENMSWNLHSGLLFMSFIDITMFPFSSNIFITRFITLSLTFPWDIIYSLTCLDTWFLFWLDYYSKIFYFLNSTSVSGLYFSSINLGLALWLAGKD